MESPFTSTSTHLADTDKGSLRSCDTRWRWKASSVAFRESCVPYQSGLGKREAEPLYVCEQVCVSKADSTVGTHASLFPSEITVQGGTESGEG